ncbi:MAG: Bax inhibitor-1 family protein [Verrucomicrobiota bacterium]|nr:Bax inhibitor-1 family protein [Verrucomicrobiota bacterium]
MSQQYMSTPIVSAASVSDRALFIRNTFIHLGLAIFGFIALEWALLQSVPAEVVFSLVKGKMWLVVLVAFMAVSWAANWMASHEFSPSIQYAGLALYVGIEAIIFLPILTIASKMSPLLIPAAGIITVVVTGLLMAIAFITKKDFSFLKVGIVVGGFVALGVIVASAFMGFQLGIWFSAIMILFASACVLFSLSNIIHQYRTTQHVAASLALFASIALLFWYILSFLMSLTSRD